MSTRFNGQVVMITGGGKGIGAATAERFAAEGAKVSCFGRDPDALAATANLIRADGGEVLVREGDVRFLEDQQRWFDEVMGTWGQVDVVVANAGIYVGGPITEIPLDRWDEIIATNFTGVMFTDRLAAVAMIPQGRGTIVNVSSMAAKTSWTNSTEYSGTKTGVIGITRALAMELGPHGITVNAVCPGNTLTDMVRSVSKQIGAELGMTGEEWLAMRAKDTALGRLGRPEEIAGVITFLASEDARYLTGQSLEVDGGLIMS